jgi:hypothetical protein
MGGGNQVMKFKKLIAAAVVLGFLAGGVPMLAHADGWGDYDSHHEWHSGDWWLEHDPGWVRKHHPDWYERGDFDSHHHWHDRAWWKSHDPKWAHEHHHDWF